MHVKAAPSFGDLIIAQARSRRPAPIRLDSRRRGPREEDEMAYQIRICGVTVLFLRGGPGFRGRLSALVELPDPGGGPLLPLRAYQRM